MNLKKNLSSGETLFIRLAEPKDAARLISYVKAVGDESNFITWTRSDFNLTVEEERALIQEHIDKENKFLILGEVDGDIVSMLGASGRQKPRLRHVVNFGITVSKAYWGRGIGRHMIDTLITWGRENPVVKKINLMVVEHNVGAAALYLSMGFEQEGILRKDFYDGGKYYDGIAMGMEV